MLLRLLVIAISISVLNSPMDARAEGLVGTVSVESEENTERPELKGQVAEKDLRPPSWIEGKVFSNEDMLMYSFFVIKPFKKQWRWEIPSHKVKIDLKPGVVRHWKGYKPEGQCPVTCIPMGEGKFKFHAERADGPHGYMERIGLTEKGFPKYRFWFDGESEESGNSTTQQDANAAPASPPEQKED